MRAQRPALSREWFGLVLPWLAGCFGPDPCATVAFLVLTVPDVFTAASGRYTFGVKSHAWERSDYVPRVEPR